MPSSTRLRNCQLQALGESEVDTSSIVANVANIALGEVVVGTARTGIATQHFVTAGDHREVRNCILDLRPAEVVLLRDGRDEQVPAEFGWKRDPDSPDGDWAYKASDTCCNALLTITEAAEGPGVVVLLTLATVVKLTAAGPDGEDPTNA